MSAFVNAEKKWLVWLMIGVMMLTAAGCSCGGGVGEDSTSGADAGAENQNNQSGAGEGNTISGTTEEGVVQEAYVPGVYEGIGQGYNGPIKVTVEVDGSKILSVEAVGEEETENVGQVAIRELKNRIVETGNTEIEGISGATFSSEGFFEAVENALAQAQVR